MSDNPALLYNSMHAYLAASAVDGVKVDCQVGFRRGSDGAIEGSGMGSGD